MEEFNKKYKAFVTELKTKAVSYIEQMMALDVKSLQLLLKAWKIYGELEQSFIHFREDYFAKTEQDMIDLANLTPSVSVNHLSYQAFGGISSNSTFLAYKNETSFMLGTWKRGIKVVEDDTVVYSENLPNHYGALKDMVYIEPHDYYLMDHDKKLWRKNVDDKPPSVFMDIGCGFRKGACLRYSKLNDRLFVAQNGNAISVINLERRQIETSTVLSQLTMQTIMDFRVLGEHQNRVIAITNSGCVNLATFTIPMRKVSSVCSLDLDLWQARKEKGFSIAVSDDDDYAFVEIEGENSYSSLLCSRMMILKINANSIERVVVVDQFNLRIGRKFAVEYAGIINGCIFWVGFTEESSRLGQVFVFNTLTEEMEEVKKMRFDQKETDPKKVHRQDNDFYYVGHFGRIIHLKLTLES